MPRRADLDPDVRSLHCPRREQDEQLVCLVEKFTNVVFKLSTDVDIGLVEERRRAALCDLTCNLTRNPRIFTGVADEYQPLLLAPASAHLVASILPQGQTGPKPNAVARNTLMTLSLRSNANPTGVPPRKRPSHGRPGSGADLSNELGLQPSRATNGSDSGLKPG